MAQKSDQIFQLSLTEIAFTIAFILLIVLGYALFVEQSARLEAEAKVASGLESTETAEATIRAEAELHAQLAAATDQSPDAVISSLVDGQRAQMERERTQQLLADLDARLTALSELRAELASNDALPREPEAQEHAETAITLRNEILREIGSSQAGSNTELQAPVSSDEILSRVTSALVAEQALQDVLKEDLEFDLNKQTVAEVLKKVAADAKELREIGGSPSERNRVRNEAKDLRGQIVFLKKRLEARGGRDYPPCWADEISGKVQFLFSVDLLNNGSVQVDKAWPSSRDEDAGSLAGASDLLAASPMSYETFRSSVQPLYAKSQKEECRHYVLLKSSIENAVKSDRARLMVENFFYKVEVTR